jgi:hypothetical protein
MVCTWDVYLGSNPTATARMPTSCTFEKCNGVKTLGLIWDPVQDVFQYSIKFKSFSEVTTKRTTLATISLIFDPLWLSGEVITSYKIFIQHIWLRKFEWDEQLPLDLQKKWILPFRSSICVPRLVKVKNKITNIQVHGFSDASQAAYGACISLRWTNEQRETASYLLCKKSGVTPVKQPSINYKLRSLHPAACFRSFLSQLTFRPWRQWRRFFHRNVGLSQIYQASESERPYSSIEFDTYITLPNSFSQFSRWQVQYQMFLTKSSTTIIIFGHYPSSCFYLKDTTFRRLDTVSVFRWNLNSWAQSIELVPISGHLPQHKIVYTSQARHKLSATAKTNINILKTFTHSWGRSTWRRRQNLVFEALF